MLGYKHTEEALEKIKSSSEGRKHSEEVKALMCIAKSGENHPLFGKTHTSSTKEKMSEAKKGKVKSTEIRSKMSISKGGGTIFVYDSEGILVNTFCSTRIAAENYKCSHVTIANYEGSLLFHNSYYLCKISKVAMTVFYNNDNIKIHNFSSDYTISFSLFINNLTFGGKCFFNFCIHCFLVRF